MEYSLELFLGDFFEESLERKLLDYSEKSLKISFSWHNICEEDFGGIPQVIPGKIPVEIPGRSSLGIPGQIEGLNLGRILCEILEEFQRRDFGKISGLMGREIYERITEISEGVFEKKSDLLSGEICLEIFFEKSQMNLWRSHFEISWKNLCRNLWKNSRRSLEESLEKICGRYLNYDKSQGKIFERIIEILEAVFERLSK